MKRIIRLVKQKWLHWIILLAVYLFIGFAMFIYVNFIMGQKVPLEMYFMAAIVLCFPYIIVDIINSE